MECESSRPQGPRSFAKNLSWEGPHPPVEVYALVDKYEIEDLKACAVEQLPQPNMKASRLYARDVSYLEQIRDVLKTHYSLCVSPNCAMRRRLCKIVIRYGDGVAKEKGFEDLAAEYPVLVANMYFATRECGSKIW
jgi:hypothetical protein